MQIYTVIVVGDPVRVVGTYQITTITKGAWVFCRQVGVATGVSLSYNGILAR